MKLSYVTFSHFGFYFVSYFWSTFSDSLSSFGLSLSFSGSLSSLTEAADFGIKSSCGHYSESLGSSLGIYLPHFVFESC